MSLNEIFMAIKLLLWINPRNGKAEIHNFAEQGGCLIASWKKRKRKEKEKENCFKSKCIYLSRVYRVNYCASNS